MYVMQIKFLPKVATKLKAIEKFPQYLNEVIFSESVTKNRKIEYTKMSTLLMTAFRRFQKNIK